MPGSSTSSSTQNTTNTPAQIGQFNTGFAADGTALGTAQKALAAQGPLTQLTANMTPQQLQAYQNLYNSANGNTSATTQGNIGALSGNAGASGIQGALNGYSNFNPTIQGEVGAGNTYAANQDIPGQVRAAMLGANQEANQVTLPGIDANAAGTGNINSSRTGVADGIVQGDLAQQAGALQAQLTAGAENTGAQLQSNNYGQSLQALAGQGTVGTGAVNAGNAALAGGVNSLGSLGALSLTGAGGNQANQQAIDTNAAQLQSNTQNAPFTALQNYMNSLNVNAGGTSNQTGTQTPSFMQTVGSLIGATGQAVGMATGNPASYMQLLNGGAGGQPQTPQSMAAGPFAISDRRLKQDIVQVGELFDGTPVYRYRYLGQQVMQIGVMAQDIEKFVPDAVAEFAGFKVVDYEKATERAVALGGGH